jgi:hypothetical protein
LSLQIYQMFALTFDRDEYSDHPIFPHPFPQPLKS